MIAKVEADKFSTITELLHSVLDDVVLIHLIVHPVCIE